MDEDDGFEDAGTGTPLSAIAEAFEELSSNGGYHDLMLKPFCDACSLVSVLFGSLGIAFKFAELEYVSKVCYTPNIPNKITTFFILFHCLSQLHKKKNLNLILHIHNPIYQAQHPPPQHWTMIKINKILDPKANFQDNRKSHIITNMGLNK